jgi:5-methylcytosine-specific restriction endonuclease McrA
MLNESAEKSNQKEQRMRGRRIIRLLGPGLGEEETDGLSPFEEAEMERLDVLFEESEEADERWRFRMLCEEFNELSDSFDNDPEDTKPLKRRMSTGEKLDVHMKRAAGDLTRQDWVDCLKAYARTCAYCGYCGDAPGALFEPVMEHVVPVSRGGQTSWNNIVPACWRCNKHKGSRDPIEWLECTGKLERFIDCYLVVEKDWEALRAARAGGES